MKGSQTKELILEHARELFLELGYEGVSMRMLASRCSISLGLIYHYFVSKDALFADVVRPVLQTLEYVLVEHNSEGQCSEAIFEDVKRGQYQIFLLLITKYRRELRLLLMHATGSPYEHYEEEFVAKNYQLGKTYLRRMGEKYPEMHTDLSEQLIKITVEHWLHVLKALLDERLSDGQRAQILLEYFAFTTAGWERLLRGLLPKLK